mgnify:CR=1 FL=1
MNIAEKVIDIVKGMEGIGGIPTDEEFLNEFEFRLQALNQGQTLPIDIVSGCPFEAYAEFCIECDRKGMKPLKYKDYLEIG